MSTLTAILCCLPLALLYPLVQAAIDKARGK